MQGESFEIKGLMKVNSQNLGMRCKIGHVGMKFNLIAIKL